MLRSYGDAAITQTAHQLTNNRNLGEHANH
jgi:hypothetical protein